MADRLDGRIAELERLRDKLTGCIGCGCLSLRSCRLLNRDDRAATSGPGARYLIGDEAEARDSWRYRSGVDERVLRPGSHVRVRLVKRGHSDVEYRAVVVSDDGTHVVVRGPWAEAEARDLGYVRFELGDVFTEHYWRDRWYSVKEVRSGAAALKGWYCDVARPVRIEDRLLVSEDLELDIWVSADRRTMLRLDEDDFAASGLAVMDPAAATEARNALSELERLGTAGFVGISPNVQSGSRRRTPT